MRCVENKIKKFRVIITSMGNLTVEFTSSSYDNLNTLIPVTIDHYLKKLPKEDISDEAKAERFISAFKKVSQTYKGKRVKSKSTGLGETCSICISSLKRNQNAKRLCCEHIFHSKCINKWCSVQQKSKLCSTCPICRSKVV